MTHHSNMLNHDQLSFSRVADQIDTLAGSSANHKGFTLVELIVIVAIIGVLAVMAIPAYNEYINKSKNAAAIGDIRTLSTEISAYYMDSGSNPDTLSTINRVGFLDPWKKEYIYNKIPVLMDILDLPLNTDFDIYSKGSDGNSEAFGGDPSNDNDIVRANDGTYVGLRP